ncbi:hypothetical protein [Aminobacter niigataensis]|uniref:hypothetical protein n=1 Tax=Aminobacter niigataensis TaxID=83265 RepID=UPI0024CA0297|nr:hypothetical protein [Aminobacter niigataensis]CAI2932457.1 protein of unknown function [Aminobacter niigataensis]
MGLAICDIAADARSTWQFVFDIDQPQLWVQLVPSDTRPYVPDYFTIEDFFEAPRANRLQKRARESLSILFAVAIVQRWQHNQLGPRLQKTPPLIG